MKTRKGIVSRLVWTGLVAAAVLTPVVRALAQDSDNLAAAGLGAGVILVCVIVGVGLYVYMSLALQTIANKTNTENSWLAWIPIANIILMLQIAKKPMWWLILFFVPLANIVIAIMIWMAVAEARGKPNWWGVLMIVPVANLIVPGMLAWAD